MTVKEVVELSAELLGVELTEENTATLLDCYNLVENELATDYFPLRTVDKVLIKENEIKYANLQRQAYRIMGVCDENSKEVKYKIYPQYMTIDKKYNGKYCLVRYAYVPKEKKIDDISDFEEGMFKDILAYEVCAEYCIINGDFEQGKLWDDKYKKAINLIWFKWKTKGA